jgi:phosphoglycerate dehydrogenase-like enzyme
MSKAKVICVSDSNDSSWQAVFRNLPEDTEIVATGTVLKDFNFEELRSKDANVVFVSYLDVKDLLSTFLSELPSLEWVHFRAAGIDSVMTDTLKSWTGTMTNAKGSFSEALAEYALTACLYFAKDLPRLLRQKGVKQWEKYTVRELKGATLGIIGFGDIGRECAKLASAFGMRIIALRRNPKPDSLCDAVYGNDTASLNRLFADSDYILCAAPLTPQTRGMIGKEQFDHTRENAVFINLGRGAVADEDALIDALTTRKLKGAGLDVFATEPLSRESPFWDLENVLLSPHNMDQTDMKLQQATEFFVKENLPRFIKGEDLLNIVDLRSGY